MPIGASMQFSSIEFMLSSLFMKAKKDIREKNVSDREFHAAIQFF